MNQTKRIVFVVGCLDPGHDGVGDYARELATRCKDKNHEVFIISLFDKAIISQTLEIQNDIRVFRLPNAINNLAQQNAAISWIRDLNPDWISMQFVCYSFHPKGICYNLTNIIKKLKMISKLHIMVHELWIGPHQGAPFKEWIVGLLQRYFVKKILKEADRLHTQCHVYQWILAKNKFKVQILPLFSNIKVIENNIDKSKFLTNLEKDETLILGFFGSLYRGFPSEKITERLKQIAQTTKKKILVVSLGNLGASANTWKNFTQLCGKAIQTLRIYPLEDQELSILLQKINYGVITTPLSILDKSSAAAAFRAHKIPILYIRDDVHFKGFEPPNAFEAISFYDDFYELKNKFSTKCYFEKPSEIVDRFLKYLN